MADTAEVTNATAAESKEKAETVEANKSQDEDDDEDDVTAEGGAAGDKKKKKKKKKTKAEKEAAEKEKEAKKGRLTKAQLALINEVQKTRKEEEEKLIKEREEKERQQREAEDRLIAKAKREQEQKEKKRQKEKERVARLKAEGKYLTAEQKTKALRAQQTVELLKQQGYEVPGTVQGADSTVVQKRPKYVDKSKTKKRLLQQQQDAKATETDPTAQANKENTDEKEVESGDDEEEDDDDEDDDDVADSWDTLADAHAALQIEQSDAKCKEKADGERSSAEPDSDGGSPFEIISPQPSTAEVEKVIAVAPSVPAPAQTREQIQQRIRKRHTDAECVRKTHFSNNSGRYRSPVVCVLGHVDVGKTKILDKIRRTNVQDGEAGGITQQIGATMVPADAIREQARMVKDFRAEELRIPGLLIIDTPGHESFSNLRARGSSLCDIAIVVVDLMHGLEPQTIESLAMLRERRIPFVVALNKIDRLYEWKRLPQKDVRDALKSQQRNTQFEFDEHVKEATTQFAEQGFNVALFDRNPDPRDYSSMVPVSAHSGDGMGNLIAHLVQRAQEQLGERLTFSESLACTVLEVKSLPGLGTTIDVILVNGRLRVGDTIVVPGVDGPIVTQIRELLMPQPLKEMRVKNPYEHFKELEGAQGVKILAKDLDKALAGLPLLVAERDDEVEILAEEVAESLKAALQSIKLADTGVYVQASTLGSLEALLAFLKESKIPYAGINIGPVHKRDVMKASVMLEHEESQYAVILAFDVKPERDAAEMAADLGVRIFQADIIYHLFDSFTKYIEDWKAKKREENAKNAVFPCRLRILKDCIFNSRAPLVMGVSVDAGVVRVGTPICVPSKEFVFLGIVTSIEENHKQLEQARQGKEVCVKIESPPSDAPKMFGRHFDESDALVSRISRETIDVCKLYFRDELQKSDWQLMVELKKIFGIV